MLKDLASKTADWLVDHPDYRILRRLVTPRAYTPNAGDPSILHRGAIIDTETTGLDPDSDKIIQICALPFQFDADGKVYGVEDPIVMFEDPGAPLTPEVVELTGITDDMLKGQRFDDDRMAELAANTVLNVAHKADFDRPLVEARFPGFVDTVWGCSMNDMEWRAKFGIRSSALDYVLARAASAFNDEHRADADCASVLHILATRAPDGTTYLSHLLDQIRKPTFRIQCNPPYGMNTKLKSRGYRAHYNGGKFAYWWKEIRLTEQFAAEEQFLIRDCQVNPPITGKKVTARERYSRRV